MKKLKHFYLIIILILIQSQSGFCQTYNPSLSISTTSANIFKNGYVEYSTSNTNIGDAYFTLLGDGYFASLKNFDHQFPMDSSGYTTITYFNRKYKVHVPTVRKKTTGITGSGNSSNNKIRMIPGTKSRVATSWSPCKGIENYFMLIFENTTATVDSGCIEFYYDDSQLSLNFTGILDYDWVNYDSNPTITGSTLYNKKLKWNFKNLSSGEQRVIYIPMTSLTSTGTKLNVGSKYSSKCSGSSSISGSSMYSSGSPHDPNTKTADRICAVPAINEQQKIIYTIRFQNEGNAPANDVILIDVLDDTLLDLSTLELLNSDYYYEYALNGNILEIIFPNIQLPGLKQDNPKTYSYDDTESYISFSICTLPYLPYGVITNSADIIFDTQPAIKTNVCIIEISEECPSFIDCYSGYKTTSTKESIEIGITASPNPVENDLFINGLTNQEVSLSIYNNQGELVLSHTGINIAHNSVQMGSLPSGMYFVQIKNESINITKKIIKL